jgi:hypothetical protein
LLGKRSKKTEVKRNILELAGEDGQRLTFILTTVLEKLIWSENEREVKGILEKLLKQSLSQRKTVNSEQWREDVDGTANPRLLGIGGWAAGLLEYNSPQRNIYT